MYHVAPPGYTILWPEAGSDVSIMFHTRKIDSFAFLCKFELLSTR